MKKLIVVLILCSSFLTACNHSVIVDGNKVDNDYANYLFSQRSPYYFFGSNLVLANGKLYYSYQKDDFEYGLFEISENGTKRIKPILKQCAIREYKNQLVIFPRSGDTSYVLEHENSEIEKIKQVTILQSEFQCVGDRIFYLDKQSDEERAEGKPQRIFEYKDGKSELLIDQDVGSFYATEDFLYYRTPKTEGTGYSYYEYCFETGMERCLFDTALNNVSNFIIHDSFLIYQNPNGSLRKVDVKKDDSGPERIECASAQICSFTAQGGIVFIASGHGLFANDLETESSTQLSSTPCHNVFVVDDKWVYFTNECSLYRVMRDGTQQELVFDAT